jgi:serine/threonine-protein kinase
MDGLAVGSVIADRFLVERLIGEGGMCLVYAARHTLTRKRLALKVLRNAHAANPGTRRRFLREARAACAVRHPNVLEIDDVLELPDSRLVLVMDLLDGESLARTLAQRRRLPLAELAPILIQVIDAVSAAHAIGIVHRDLKPENIFVVRAASGVASVKVLDFGIAKLTASDGDAARSDTETRMGAMLGTPYYMAPEQVLGASDLDYRADIWSLGVILYEALSGVRPIEGHTVPEILLRVTRGDIVPLEDRVPGLPRAVADAVAQMLNVEREERPATLRELRRILRECASRGTATPAPTTYNRTPSQRPVAFSLSETKTLAERRLPVLPALGAVAVFGIGFAGAQAIRGAQERPAPATMTASLVGAEVGRRAAAAGEGAAAPPAPPASEPRANESAGAMAKPAIAAPVGSSPKAAVPGDRLPETPTPSAKPPDAPRGEASIPIPSIPIPPPEPQANETDAPGSGTPSRRPSPPLDRDNPWAAPAPQGTAGP